MKPNILKVYKLKDYKYKENYTWNITAELLKAKIVEEILKLDREK